MKIELIAVTLLVLALIGLAAYKLAVATSTGLTVFWGIILVANIFNCWKLLKAYANLCA